MCVQGTRRRLCGNVIAFDPHISAEVAQNFIDRIADVSRKAAARDYGMLLDRKRED